MRRCVICADNQYLSHCCTFSSDSLTFDLAQFYGGLQGEQE
jgi:hypothetical protein